VSDVGQPQRRRGAALEQALVDAAWAELQRAGYDGFTIDAVAKSAGTSRAVVYRRWPNRAALVLTLVQEHFGSIADEVPDTGDLRDDVLEKLRGAIARIEAVGVDVMTGLLSELDDVPDALMSAAPDVFRRIIERARERGEIGPGPIPESVVTVPIVMARYAMMATREPPSEERLRAIVDELFMPLVRYYAGTAAD
jgi:Transcriptional regulator